MPGDAREREIRKYTRTESQHLRLRRTKIKLADFRTVKVIGKGAFGEVLHLATSILLWISPQLTLVPHPLFRFDWCKRWTRAVCMP
jgi:hypothetical protein